MTTTAEQSAALLGIAARRTHRARNHRASIADADIAYLLALVDSLRAELTLERLASTSADAPGA